MIIDSTPGSITWLSADGKKIKYLGEWTLEPKFYLDLASACEIKNDGKLMQIGAKDIKKYLSEFLVECKGRGWDIVIELGCP